MRLVAKTAICGVACVLGTGLLRAADGVLIVTRMTMGSGAPQTTQVQIEKSRMRADINDPNGGKQAMIVDTGRGVMDIVNFDKKSYMEITKAQMEQMAQMMNQMQASMAAMPAAQRAQMEGMMRGRGMGMSVPTKPEFKKTGTDKVGKWTCDKYEGYENGQKVTDVCTVEPAVLGLSAVDMANFQSFADSFKSIIPQAASSFAMGKPEDKGYSGIPVRTSSTAMTSEITDVSHQIFPESLFTIPADFQKQDMGSMMGGMGGARGRGRD